MDERADYGQNLIGANIHYTDAAAAQVRDDIGGPYSYDTFHIQYRQIPESQWHLIANDQSAYSHLWASAESFIPQNFSHNSSYLRKWNDIIYAVLFYVNLLISIFLAAHFIAKMPSSDFAPSLMTFFAFFGLGTLVGIILSLFHFAFVLWFPGTYANFGMAIDVLASTTVCIFPVIYYRQYIFVGFLSFVLVLFLIFFLVCRQHFGFSASLLSNSSKLIAQFPFLIFFALSQVIVVIAINALFSLLILGIQRSGISGWIYVYAIFSYCITAKAVSYVSYLTAAGLVASWYFLKDTPFFPIHPVWTSFKRATSTSFGSACLAGFFLKFIMFFKAIARATNERNKICAVIRCLVVCFLRCLESFVRWMSKSALIYCAIFGVPYCEGCRRWAELCCKKFTNVLTESCTVDESLIFSWIVFTFFAGIIGYIIEKEAFSEVFPWLGIISSMSAFGFLLIFSEPLEAITDTVFVCYSEMPEKLNELDPHLSTEIAEIYRSMVLKRITSHS